MQQWAVEFDYEHHVASPVCFRFNHCPQKDLISFYILFCVDCQRLGSLTVTKAAKLWEDDTNVVRVVLGPDRVLNVVRSGAARTTRVLSRRSIQLVAQLGAHLVRRPRVHDFVSFKNYRRRRCQ